MSDQTSLEQKELSRLREFAVAAISFYAREQFDRAKGELPSYNVASPHTAKESRHRGDQYSAAVQRGVQLSIDRIDRIDVEERNVQFLQAAKRSVIGRNHIAELERLVQKYGNELNRIFEIEWRKYYVKQGDSISRNISTV